MLSETQTTKIFQQIKKTPPKIIIIDSIQTLQTARVESSPGSTTGGEQKAEENVKNNEDSNPAPGGHHTMEFFEMCAALITQLAR